MSNFNNIIHFILDHRVGGPHKYYESILKHLDDKYKILLVTSGRGNMTDISIFNLRRFSKIMYFFEVPLNVTTLFFFILIRKIPNNSIFHVHGAANIAPIITAFIFRVPIVWHFHETLYSHSFFANIGKFFIKYTNHKVLTVAHRSAVVYSLKDYLYSPPGIDTSFWSTDSVGGVSEKQTEKVIVSVGNISPLKGHDILVKSLVDVHYSWKLIIVGSRLKTQDIFFKKLINDSKEVLRNKKNCDIQIVGCKNSEQIRKILMTSDLFVLPSLSEACPISLLEAMSMNCFCISTNVGDIQNIFCKYDNNIIIPPNRKDLLSWAINESLGMVSKGIKSNSRKCILNTVYDVKNSLIMLSSLYEALLKK